MSDVLGERRLPDLRGYRTNRTGRLGAPMDAEESDRSAFVFDLCWACNGTGFCRQCGGDGRYIPRGLHVVFNCTGCDGSGACRICGGTGHLRPEADRG